jgi:hypothetical protein
MGRQLRVKNVVVAIVHDPAMRFLVCYNRNRRYRFFIYRVTFPGVDLAVPANAVEQALNDNGVKFGWFSEAQLAAPAAHRLSPTVTEVRLYALQACP